MSCVNQTIGGLEKDCSRSKGGISKVYLINYDDVIGQPTVADGEITDIEIKPEASFKDYYFRKNTGSMTSTLNVDPANGVNYVNTDLALQFLKMETVKRIEMAALSVNDLAAIVKDSNGVYFYLGYDEPIVATAGDGTTGTAAGDGNRYTITLQDTSDTFPYVISAEAITKLGLA